MRIRIRVRVRTHVKVRVCVRFLFRIRFRIRVRIVLGFVLGLDLGLRFRFVTVIRVRKVHRRKFQINVSYSYGNYFMTFSVFNFIISCVFSKKSQY